MSDLAVKRVLGYLAWVVPLVTYASATSSHGYWLDAGEFIAAAVNLGIAHPPGHPLYALLAHTFGWFPIGSLELRVALFSAAMAATASLFFYRTLVRLSKTIVQQDSSGLRLVCLTATLGLCAANTMVIQAIRPEVYALQAVLSAFMIERTLKALLADHAERKHPLIQALLCGGLSLTNHHLLGFVVIACLAPAWIYLLHSISTGKLWLPRYAQIAFYGCAAFLPLLTYLYLPLRGLKTSLTPNLGAPVTWERFVWVVSAKTFQKNSGTGVAQAADERVMDVIVALAQAHGIWILPVALIGFYLLLRVRRLRWIGILLGLLCVIPAGIRAWLGFVRHNPDALGYLLPSSFALVSLTLVAAVMLIGALRISTRVLTGLTVLFCAGTGALGLHSLQHDSLNHFSDTDALDDFRRRNLPSHAVLFAHLPETIFRHWGAEAVEHLRPDISLIPMPFVTYPGMAASLIDQDPDVRTMLNTLDEGEYLTRSAIIDLGKLRNVCVELDLRVRPDLYDLLRPGSNLVYQAHSAMTVGEGSRQQTQSYQKLAADLPTALNRFTSSTLLWHHYNDALYYAAMGDVQSALHAVRRAEQIAPQARELQALHQALTTTKGPLDPRHFWPTSRFSPP